jgi:hypothetical protein
MLSGPWSIANDPEPVASDTATRSLDMNNLLRFPLQREQAILPTRPAIRESILIELSNLLLNSSDHHAWIQPRRLRTADRACRHRIRILLRLCYVRAIPTYTPARQGCFIYGLLAHVDKAARSGGTTGVSFQPSRRF